MLSFIQALVARLEKQLTPTTRPAVDEELEHYLSKAADLSELENMQRNWDRDQRRTSGVLF